MSDEGNERAGRVVMRLVGGLMIAVGALLAFTCGAITAAMWSTCAALPGQPGPFVILGLIPTLLGVLMVAAGLILLFVARPRPQGSPKAFE